MKKHRNFVLEWDRTFSYYINTQKYINYDLSGSARSGEIIGVLGSSGSGKSEFIDLFSGCASSQLYASISIKVNGINVSLFDFYNYSEYLYQSYLYFGFLTVEEFINYSIRIKNGSENDVSQIMHSLDLDGILNVLMYHLTPNQLKRVFIVRVLCSDKPILILNDPLSFLDSDETKFVLDSLRKKADKGKLIIMSVNYPTPETIDFLDKLYFLTDGILIFFGTIF